MREYFGNFECAVSDFGDSDSSPEMVVGNRNRFRPHRVVQNGEYWEGDLVAALFELLRWRFDDEVCEGLKFGLQLRCEDLNHSAAFRRQVLG
jgi:hypothetical protein